MAETEQGFKKNGSAEDSSLGTVPAPEPAPAPAPAGEDEDK